MLFGPLPFTCITFANVFCLFLDTPRVFIYIYEPFYVVNIIFRYYMIVEFNSFNLNSLLPIFDLAHQSGDQLGPNLT